MFKYIKWELFDFRKSNFRILILISAIYGLFYFIPFSNDGFLTTLIALSFFIVIFVSCFSIFIYGSKKVIDTFRKPTFMLESMISFSPYKILLAKYLLAILLNFICAFIFIFGILIVVAKMSTFPKALNVLVELFVDINIIDLLRSFIYLVILSTTFTAIVTFCYILSRCLFPNRKGSIIFGIILWYFITYITEEFFNFISLDISSFIGFSILSIIRILFIAGLYLATVKLIENKLEIYS